MTTSPDQMSDALRRCHAHIQASVRQGRMRELDDASLTTALIAEGLILNLGIDQYRADLLVVFCLLLAAEIVTEESSLKFEKRCRDAVAVARARGVAEDRIDQLQSAIAEARARTIERRASHSPLIRPPHAVTVWARGIARSFAEER